MDFNVRALTTKDWDTLVEWWDWWPGWTAPPKIFYLTMELEVLW